MARIGARECLLPAMHPAELGMTHEEVVTALALELRSYRDLPQVWYQFQTKFRDEPAPRAGCCGCGSSP